MKYLIAGLGNIGEEYSHTRHNIGFDVLDALAEKEGISFLPDRLAHHTEFKFKGRTFHLIKPTTYMNLSGKAVRFWLSELKISPENLLVVTDDLALPFGKLRLRKNGSHGGHNGLKNIIEVLETSEFPRLRFGIGDNFHKGAQVNYVLQRWSSEEEKSLPEIIERTMEAVKNFGTIGVERTMNQFN